MKQVLLHMKKGEITVDDVPPPNFKGKGVIVENHYSVISGGTENSTIQLGKSSYLGKAKKKPDLFMKVVDMARKQGPLTAYQAVKGALNKPIALGYSSAGVVKKSSSDSNFKKGDRVACAGQDYASHSDMVYVPEKLTVKVPDNVSLRDASYTTIGAIAMQGVRNADPRLGERVVVIGLGLIGQITVQILKAAGCRVFGIDIDDNKIETAKKIGMDEGSNAASDSVNAHAEAFTGGHGFDAVIITAATSSNAPLVQAGEISRKKGKVVLVGVVGMEIPRDIYYDKELEFVVSNSYGPGRKDPDYEEMGNDYPISYVRWTENRNMEAFLELISQGKIDISKITSHEYPINDAPKAYAIITSENKEPYMGMVLEYDIEKEDTSKIVLKESQKHEGDIGIGWIGAGSFATTTLLPALKGIAGLKLVGLSAGSGISTRSAAENHGFNYCTSDYNELLDDNEIDAVIVTTRNSLHAEIASAAMKKGKHVFVEKPLAINKKELNNLVRLNKKYPEILVQVGFNRRYAPLTKRIKEKFKNRKGPMMMHYRVNAGKLPSNYWVYEEREGSSRFISEMCHFIDYCRHMAGCEIIDSHVFNIEHDSLSENEQKENVTVSLKFEDGSVANILYNSFGESKSSKEYFELQCENTTVKLFDFREVQFIKDGKISKSKDHLKTDKGHSEELVEFISNIRNGMNPFNEYIETTRITLK